MKTVKLLVIAVLLFQFQQLFAQKTKVTLETIKEECKDLPLEKRLRLTVARFSVTTNVDNPPSEFGDNLATMLTNALQQVNCYRVLESLKDSSDMNKEINYGEGKYANKKTTPKKGKQLGAQVVVTGEITEYSSKNTGVGVGLVHVGSNKAKIGFIIKMVNPETRDVLYSKSINVEGKAGGSTSFGLLGVNMVNTVKSDPAVANAVEQGIIQAVEFIASKKDLLQSFNDSQAAANPGAAAGVNETQVTIANADYKAFTSMAAILPTVKGYKSMDKALDAGVATFTVSHMGSTDELLEQLNAKLTGTHFEVTGFGQGKIDMMVK